MLAEHYAKVEQMMGKPVADPMAHQEPMPQGGDYLVRLFFEINHNRKFLAVGMGDTMSLPLSDGDILDYLALHQDELQLWEIELLRKLDQVYLAAIREKKAGQG